jgi:hypothetical protein
VYLPIKFIVGALAPFRAKSGSHDFLFGRAHTCRIPAELSRILRDPPKGGLEDEEVLMTKHRTITGFMAVALLAVAATAVIMRSHSPWIDGTMLLKGLGVDATKAPIEDFDDRWSAMFTLSPTTDTAQHGLDVR